jgi:hypothetical protein
MGRLDSMIVFNALIIIVMLFVTLLMFFGKCWDGLFFVRAFLQDGRKVVQFKRIDSFALDLC